MFKTISKKVIAGVSAITMTLALVAGVVTFNVSEVKAAGPVTATITYTAQYDGAFKDIKVKTAVSSDTAENMGYTDGVAVEDGVSLLDVWVQIHKDIFPAYNAENKDEYFAVADSAYGVSITNAFAKNGSVVSYYKNGTMPMGLNETVSNGDVFDAFYYQDADWSDSYTHFNDVQVEDGYIEGKLVRDGYDASWNLTAIPVAHVDLAWLNLDTLELINANTYGSPYLKTAEDGSFSLEMPNTSGNYLLTVYDNTVDGTPLVRTLCVNYPTSPKVVTAVKSQDEELNIYTAAGAYLAKTNKSIRYGDSKEGYLLGLGRGGYPVSSELYSGYYNSVVEYLAANNNKFSSVTECAKVVGALNAIGYDATNVNGVDITTQLSDATNVSGEYGYAYVLLALETKGYASDAKDIYVNKLIEAQKLDGGWGWNTGSDVDTTGMVLAALAPYADGVAKDAVAKAVEYLSKVQGTDGAFASGMDENSNSTAMAVLGLSEVGINADTDSRFVKGGVSAVDALCSYAVADGGFGWTDNAVVNDYATYQSYYALNSYVRCANGMNRLFNMTVESSIQSLDGAITVSDPSGVLPAGAIFKSELLSAGDAYNAAVNLINKAYNNVVNAAVIEINLFDGSMAQVHQLNGKVFVKVKMPFAVSAGNKLVAYRVDGDKLVECDVQVQDGYAVLGTDHFSTFVFAEVPADAVANQDVIATGNVKIQSAPKTGDSLLGWLLEKILGI